MHQLWSGKENGGKKLSPTLSPIKPNSPDSTLDSSPRRAAAAPPPVYRQSTSPSFGHRPPASTALVRLRCFLRPTAFAEPQSLPSPSTSTSAPSQRLRHLPPTSTSCRHPPPSRRPRYLHLLSASPLILRRSVSTSASSQPPPAPLGQPLQSSSTSLLSHSNFCLLPALGRLLSLTTPQPPQSTVLLPISGYQLLQSWLFLLQLGHQGSSATLSHMY